MKLHPHNGTVLCKMINAKNHRITEKGIVFDKEELPLYEIIELGDLDSKYNFNVGDIIVSNSEPSRLKVEDQIYWLIKQEYIAGKVI